MADLDLKPSDNDILNIPVGTTRPLVWNVLATDTTGAAEDISGDTFRLIVGDARINNSDVAATALESTVEVLNASIASAYTSGTTTLAVSESATSTLTTVLRPHGRYALINQTKDRLESDGRFTVVNWLNF